MRTHKPLIRLSLTLLAIGAAAFPMAAQADFVPFASFSNGYFTFTNIPAVTGPGGTVASAKFVSQTTQPQPVNFVFDETVSFGGTTYNAGQPFNAFVTLTASSNGISSTTPLPGGKTQLDQPVLESSSVPGDTALHFFNSLGQNLLTVDAFTGDISGKANGGTANLASDTSNTDVPDTLFYSSDFLMFGDPTMGSDSIGLTLTQNVKLTRNANGFLNSFNAIGDGTFTSPNATPAPEPSGMFSLSVLGGCLALCAARRKKLSA